MSTYLVKNFSTYCLKLENCLNYFVRGQGYESNTSGKLFSLPVIFALEEVGEGQILLFRYL